MALCQSCNGCGKQDQCAECENNGWVEDEDDGGTITCLVCDGLADMDCEDCEGTGVELD